MTGNKKVNDSDSTSNKIVIGGNVQGSNIVIGNGNNVLNKSVNVAQFFDDINRTVDASTGLSSGQKQDVKDELLEIRTALESSEPDEGFLARRFRNLQRMAPDIVEVAFETLKNPIGGVAEVIRRIAKKVKEEANANK